MEAPEQGRSLSSNWEEQLEQKTAHLDPDVQQELKETAQNLSTEFQHAVRILTSALGDAAGVQLIAAIGNAHMPKENNQPKYRVTIEDLSQH